MMNNYGMYATKNRSVLSIFKNVYEYPLPSDFADIINLTVRGEKMNYDKLTPSEFWRRLDRNTISIDTIKGSRFLLVNRPSAGLEQRIHDMDSLTTNGTWAVVAGTDAANISTDTVNKVQGSASISFDIDVSNSGNDYAAIANSTLTAINLTAYQNKGTVFASIYLPNATYISGFTLRFGSDSSNYRSISVTSTFDGRDFTAGRNIVGFKWTDGTDTGSPSYAAVDYTYIQATYSSSQTDMTGILIDDLVIRTPEVLELHYYSNTFFKDVSGTPKITISAGDDETLTAYEDDDVFYYWALADSQLIKQRTEEYQLAKKDFDTFLASIKHRYMSERKMEKAYYYRR